jgi:alkyldihydroxyacetonephosphate synthase
MQMPPFPASAAGPDLREVVLGSEGRLGILTEATVRVTPVPARESFHVGFFPDWERAREATRRIIQSGADLTLLRLSTPGETEMNLLLAGHRRALALLARYLDARGAGPERCMLLVGFAGDEPRIELARRETLALAKAHGGVHTGEMLGRAWQRGRFRAPYLRNELWARGYGVETVETATVWENVPAMIDAVETALRGALAGMGERVHAFTHLSHLYPSGSSVYTTFLFRLGADAGATFERWRLLKQAASEAIVANEGTISHQHGVGSDHKGYLAAEKGPLGIEAIEQVARVYDPGGMMNPGKLVGDA